MMDQIPSLIDLSFLNKSERIDTRAFVVHGSLPSVPNSESVDLNLCKQWIEPCNRYCTFSYLCKYFTPHTWTSTFEKIAAQPYIWCFLFLMPLNLEPKHHCTFAFRCRFCVKYDVTQPGQFLQWQFKIRKGHGLGFGIYRKATADLKWPPTVTSSDKLSPRQLPATSASSVSTPHLKDDLEQAEFDR